MISQALKLIVNQLNSAIPTTEGDAVALDNIALMDGQNNPGNPNDLKKLVVSLVNVQEESTLKNGTNYSVSGGGITYKNRPVHINMFLLISSNFSDYSIALEKLGQVIAFFQGKQIFTFDNSPLVTDDFDPTDEKLRRMRVIMDLYSLTFEQVNHLWGALGGSRCLSSSTKHDCWKSNLAKPWAKEVSWTSSILTKSIHPLRRP